MSDRFKSDSFNGLIYKLADIVSELVKSKEQTKSIQDIFNEMAKRLNEQENELSDVIDSIDNIKGML